MQERRLGAALYTAIIIFQVVCPGNTQVTSSEDVTPTGIRPESVEEESTTEEVIQSEPLVVTLSGEAQILESTTNKQSLKDANVTTTLGPPITSISQYRLINRDGVSCVLLQVDCTITFTYKMKSGEVRDGSIYMPGELETDGDCRSEDTATFVLRWDANMLTWDFAKTPGHDRWYVNGIELRVDASQKPFQNINKPGPRLLTTPKDSKLFPTPVGKSYSCQSETSVELQDGDVSAELFLRGFKLQAFSFKQDFGPEYECSPGGARAYRDETAPIAVGSTLAIVVLLTVTGYGGYRYFKIKKVQYDTME